MHKIQHHPAFYIKQYHSILLRIILTSLVGFVWFTFTITLIIKNKGYISNISSSTDYFTIGFIYSWCIFLLSFYILLACILSYFLASRNWLKTSALIASILAISFLFGIFQIPYFFNVFISLEEEKWFFFFKWWEKKDYNL